MIELKVGYNKPSIYQQKWIDNLNARGYKAVICYSLEEFAEVFTEYIKTI